MKKYDFDRMVDRRNQGSIKWDAMKKAMGDAADDTLVVSTADMDFAMAPEIVETLQQNAGELIYGYTWPTCEYYDAVLHWMKRRHRWDVEKESIVYVPGIVASLYYFLYALTKPGDGVIIQTPVYAPFRHSVTQTGRRLLANPLVHENGGYVIDFDDLEQKAAQEYTKMLILCSPHNPVGRVWKRWELERIADICLRHGIFVISDEIHFDIVFPPHEQIVFATLSSEVAGRCAICTSPSKSFNIAGLQVSNIMITDGGVRKKFLEASHACGFHSLNCFACHACIAAYDRAEPWLDAMLEYVAANDRFVRDELQNFVPSLKISPLEATYLQWMDCTPLGLEPLQLQRLMQKKANVFFEEGTVFGDEGKGFERFNIAYPRSVVEEVVRRVKQAVAPYCLSQK
ncbi:MAG: pyridoxal phosphate-dependent aminotransferase [Planctomycetaceae bacterium]|nr:pyridoxal phosphate-dependent aminotransferase [Planctomycetaceae bacterium]